MRANERGTFSQPLVLMRILVMRSPHTSGEIPEMPSTDAAGEEKPQNALVAAKKFLQEKSPEFAEIIYQLAKDENAPQRETCSGSKVPLAAER
jgi:hypothetical protein